MIFIDEIDAIGKKRGSKDVYGDKVLNTILALMSDVEKQDNEVYMIAATNNYEILDPALTRSGRFSVKIEVGLPDKKGLLALLDLYTRNEIMDESVNKDDIINLLEKAKYSGADVKYLVEEAKDCAFERLGFFELMEDESFTQEDMSRYKITNDDVMVAYKRIKNNKKG